MGTPTLIACPGQELRRACEVARPGVTGVVGRQAFVMLLSRALALTKDEFVWLAKVAVDGDGSLVGIEDAASGQSAEAVGQGCRAVFAHLIAS